MSVKKKYSPRRVEELLGDVENWPLFYTSSPERYGMTAAEILKHSGETLFGNSPSLFKRIPAGLTDLLGYFCKQGKEGRWYGYGWSRDETVSTPGEVVLLGTRFEQLGYLPNARALLDVHSECDEGAKLFTCIEDLEDRLEKHVVGSVGMRRQLDFFRSYKFPIAGEENHVPFFVRVTVRPDGRAADRDGFRVSERVLQSFLTGMYGESFALAVDQVAEEATNPKVHLSWHWLEPPEDHRRGPVLQYGRYDVGANRLTRDPPLKRQ